MLYLIILSCALVASLIGNICQWDDRRQMDVWNERYRIRIKHQDAALEHAARDYHELYATTTTGTPS